MNEEHLTGYADYFMRICFAEAEVMNGEQRSQHLAQHDSVDGKAAHWSDSSMS
jgi:hypothetical protein